MIQNNSEAVDAAVDWEQYRFDWADLPALTAEIPGTRGLTRVSLEDFVVSEISRGVPDGTGGEFAYAYVEKRGLNTHDLVAALRERGVPYNDVGVAGLKDKNAVTRQWLSVPAKHSGALEALDEQEGVRVLELSRHSTRLRRGHLSGNRFEVRVRQPDANWEQFAMAVLEQLKAAGLPNYFGPQRFGRFNSNAIDAVRMIRGEKVPGGRRLNDFFISALQAHLFNWNLKRRLEQGLYNLVLNGDRARRHDTGGMFLVGDAAVESERSVRLEISAVLPLYGRKVSGGLESAFALEDEVLRRFALRRSDFRRHSRGAWRISRVKPEDVALRACPDGYTVEFTLPNGAYATTFMREMTKQEAGASELETGASELETGASELETGASEMRADTGHGE